MGMGDGSTTDYTGMGSLNYQDPNYIDPSVFTNQDFSGAFGTPGYGVDMSSGAPNQFIGSLADLPANTVGNIGGGGSGIGSALSLGKILGGLGSTIGALGPALSAAGQIAKLALDQQGDRLHFPNIPPYAHFTGTSPAQMTGAPKLAGEATTTPDPLAMYAEMVRSMR